jgi:parvulin-like peptidyl-prolyl isomerase
VKRLLVCVLALVAVIVSGCGTIRPYAAKVNGARITQRDLESELRAISANTEYVEQIESAGVLKVRGSGPQTYDPTFVARVLTREIFYRLVGDEIVRRKVPITAAARADARQSVVQQVGGEAALARFQPGYRNTLIRRQTELVALTNALAASESPIPQDARAYYDANKAMFDSWVCASHILVTERAAADAIVARLARGEDFAAIARTESIDNQGPTGGSAAKGGDLGCADPKSYVAQFAAAVQNQPVGQASAPLQTQFGFHIIKVTARPPAFEQLRSQVEQQIAAQSQQQGQNALNKWLRDTVRRASVNINPRYGTFSKDPSTFGVVAPESAWEPSLEPKTTTTSPA